MADEYVDLVCKLFDSWDEGAVLMDRARGVYADHTKVRPSISKASTSRVAGH